jgi:uncharacterized protein YukE
MLPTPDGGGGGGGDKKGMDTGKVKDIAGRLHKAQADLKSAKADADSAAHKLESNWKGPDATRFQGSWKKHSAKIDECVADINAMTKQLNADIAEQDAGSR